MSSVLPSKLKGVLICTLDGTGTLPLQESSLEQKAFLSVCQLRFKGHPPTLSLYGSSNDYGLVLSGSSQPLALHHYPPA